MSHFLLRYEEISRYIFSLSFPWVDVVVEMKIETDAIHYSKDFFTIKISNVTYKSDVIMMLLQLKQWVRVCK